MDKTPDQIRKATVPVKHNGLIYGVLGAVAGAVVWFSGWGLLHQEQVLRYPDYFLSALDTHLAGFSLPGQAPKRHAAGAAELRYDLLRYGNLDHYYDAQLLRRGWYPKGTANPVRWVHEHGAIAAVYTRPAARVFDWPITLWLVTTFASAIWGFASDHRYHMRLIVGIPFDGSVVATVAQYNAEVKGDGMKYAVKPWRDR